MRKYYDNLMSHFGIITVVYYETPYIFLRENLSDVTKFRLQDVISQKRTFNHSQIFRLSLYCIYLHLHMQSWKELKLNKISIAISFRFLRWIPKKIEFKNCSLSSIHCDCREYKQFYSCFSCRSCLYSTLGQKASEKVRAAFISRLEELSMSHRVSYDKILQQQMWIL